jgi:replicative DNA helicase
VNVANAAYQREGGLAGISTGLIDMDKKLGGLHKSDLLILAGRPSMGKTSLATNLAFNIAKAYRKGEMPDGTTGALEGGGVGFFSLEMSAEQLASRILAEASEISSHKIRQGDMDEGEFRRFVEAAKALEACPLYIDDTPALPISQVAARSRRLKRTHGLDLIIVDYLQLLRGTADNRVQEIAEISMGLKAIAKELNIPVIALSQLSRQVESRDDKRPQLSDLRESGSIEQDADVVMFVFREEYYAEREKPSEDRLEEMAAWQERMARLHAKAEVIIGKQRHGPIGTVELSFESQFTRFGNLVKPWQQEGGDAEF